MQFAFSCLHITLTADQVLEFLEIVDKDLRAVQKVEFEEDDEDEHLDRGESYSKVFACRLALLG